MPTYDFTCLTCDKTIELHFAFNDLSRPTCETCGNQLNKVYSPTPAHFKGGGWGAK